MLSGMRLSTSTSSFASHRCVGEPLRGFDDCVVASHVMRSRTHTIALRCSLLLGLHCRNACAVVGGGVRGGGFGTPSLNAIAMNLPNNGPWKPSNGHGCLKCSTARI